MTVHVSMWCNLQVADDQLVVEYTLQNDGGEAAAFNRLQSIALDGGRDFSPDSVFREVRDGTLTLSKMALAIPPGLTVNAYIPPYATRLAPGARFSERVRVERPVLVRQPFLRALLDGQVTPSKPVSVRTMVFAVGVFPVDADTTLVAENPAFPGVMTVQPPWSALRDQVVLQQRFDLSLDLTVFDYAAAPWD